jgi:hypothetical protein
MLYKKIAALSHSLFREFTSKFFGQERITGIAETEQNCESFQTSGHKWHYSSWSFGVRCGHIAAADVEDLGVCFLNRRR